MQVFGEFVEIKNLSLGLGFFDGIHLAHKEIINNTVSLAHKNNIKSAIITFNSAPTVSLNKNIQYKYIETKRQKIKEIESLGVNYLFILDFEKIKNLEAIKYLEMLNRYFAPKFITTGFNNNFGLNARGNSEFLKEQEKKFGYKYYEIEPQNIDGKLISSTIIKQFIELGDIKSANKFLGKDFSVYGVVEHGNQIGRKINFPTANITWREDIIKLPYGVYSGYVKIDNLQKKALINWGKRPTIDNKEVLEAHIIDFNRDVYNKEIEIYFTSFIREQKKFSSLSELQKQLQKDITSDNNIQDS